jgi:hypothetical protein
MLLSSWLRNRQRSAPAPRRGRHTPPRERAGFRPRLEILEDRTLFKATLPKNHTFTAADKGVHTFTGLVLRKRGNQKITITHTHLGALTGSVTVDVL